MKKHSSLVIGLVLAGSLLVAPALPATAATAATAKASAVKIVTFKNCTALHKKYPGGVSKAGVTRNVVSGKKRAFKVKPKSSTALYKANKKLDRDKDGIACEK